MRTTYSLSHFLSTKVYSASRDNKILLEQRKDWTEMFCHIYPLPVGNWILDNSPTGEEETRKEGDAGDSTDAGNTMDARNSIDGTPDQRRKLKKNEY